MYVGFYVEIFFQNQFMFVVDCCCFLSDIDFVGVIVDGEMKGFVFKYCMIGIIFFYYVCYCIIYGDGIYVRERFFYWQQDYKFVFEFFDFIIYFVKIQGFDYCYIVICS